MSTPGNKKYAIATQSPEEASVVLNPTATSVSSNSAVGVLVNATTPSTDRVFALRSSMRAAATLQVTKRITTTEAPNRKTHKLKKSLSLEDLYQQNVREAVLYHAKDDSGIKVQVKMNQADHGYATIIAETLRRALL